jgi:putative RNA 2'-phosphotransferase
MDTVRTSKFLSLVLRHKPEEAGLTLDASGWCPVADVLKGCKLTREELDLVVNTNDKKRFEYSADGKRIRASQGHSIEVDLKYEPVEPPEFLFHGTATRFLDSIKKQGLVKGSRQHVHLSGVYETAVKVGKRHGKPAVLLVEAYLMHGCGHEFYLTPNGVWLTDSVPPEYLKFENLFSSETE